MKNIKLTEKELDAIDCMIQFWYAVDKEFETRSHGKFRKGDQEILMKKLLDEELRILSEKDGFKLSKLEA
jgi:hypothetical protein